MLSDPVSESSLRDDSLLLSLDFLLLRGGGPVCWSLGVALSLQDTLRECFYSLKNEKEGVTSIPLFHLER